MTSTPSQSGLLDAGPAAGEGFEGEVQVEYVRWCSDDGHFAVVEVSLPDGSPLCAVGPIGHLEEDSRARLSGTFELHARHGLQLAAREAEPLDPAGIDGARRYLKSLPGIGTKRADELIDRHGEALFDAIDRDPEVAFAALKGLTDERAAEAAEEWANRRAERRLYALLSPHGLARHVGELVAIHGIHAAECLHSSHAPRLVSRNLLYTAVTRAQQLCVLAGDERALRRALANTDALDRHSRLVERMLAF